MENAFEHDTCAKELFKLLAKTSSSLAKKDIIISNSENEHFKQFLNYLLNPFLITGISEKKIHKDTNKPPTQQFSAFTELMEFLFIHNTGTDEIIANIQQFLSSFDPEMRGFYVSIITKSARIGCDIKSVNKALGFEFIPQWEVQQGYNIEKSPLKEDEWFSLSHKLNGVRGTFFDGKIISRQGKEFTGLGHIISDIESLFSDSGGWVLDGELIRLNTEGISDNENFRIGTGLLSKDDTDKSAMNLVIFDMLPKQEFLENESRLTYKNRLAELNELRNKILKLDLKSLSIVEVLYTGCDAEKIDFYLEQMVSEDKEGLMLNRDSKYYRKRHNGILKVKRFYTVDLRVIGYEEGSGRLAGKLGAFVVDYKGNTLNVGSGMTDEQRVDFWSLGDELIGRIIEVKYKEESKDKKTGLNSLQFPIFVALREEGKVESYY
jgi:DNA ligase-1